MLLKVVFVVFLMDLVITCTGLCSPTCSVTGWGSWSNCSVSGTQTREKLYCCPQGITTIVECLQNCSIIRESPSSQACDYSGSKSVTSGVELKTQSNISEYNLLTAFLFEPFYSFWILKRSHFSSKLQAIGYRCFYGCLSIRSYNSLLNILTS